MLSRTKSLFAMSSYKLAGPRLRFPSTGMKGSFGRVLLLLSLLILLVACSSTSQLPTPAPTAHSPAHPTSTLTSGNGGGTGLIALACESGGKAEICNSKLDGSAPLQLTLGSGTDLFPGWSPVCDGLVCRSDEAHEC